MAELSLHPSDNQVFVDFGLKGAIRQNNLPDFPVVFGLFKSGSKEKENVGLIL